jgi:hypothetical protein
VKGKHVQPVDPFGAARAAVKGAEGPSRRVDYLIGLTLGLRLVNPFIKKPRLVEDVDNEWMVVDGDDWSPLPRYTGFTDVAAATVEAMFPGVRVDILHDGPGRFRAILSFPDGRRHEGGSRPTRPLAVIGAWLQMV